MTTMKPEQTVDLQALRADHRTGEVDFIAVARVLWRRKTLIVWTTAILTVVVAVLTFLLAPKYDATVYIMIDPEQSQIVTAMEVVMAGEPPDSATIESEARILQSRNLAGRVVTALQLDKDPEFNPLLQPTSPVSKLLGPIMDLVTARVAVAKDWLTDLLGESQPRGTTASEDPGETLRVSIVDKFLANLSVAIDGRSRVVGVTFTSESPETAAQAANTLADTYIATRLETKADVIQAANQWLNDRLVQLRQQVEARTSC